MSHALPQSPLEVAPARPSIPDAIGPHRAWKRDFAIVGATSGFLTPALVAGLEPIFAIYAVVAMLAGALSGWFLGGMLPATLTSGSLSKTPLWALCLVVPLIGLGWGTFVGFVGGLFTFPPAIPVSIMFAAPAAALQLSWLWLAYLFARRAGGPWPALVVTAACLTPVLGAAALFGLGGSPLAL